MNKYYNLFCENLDDQELAKDLLYFDSCLSIETLLTTEKIIELNFLISLWLY